MSPTAWIDVTVPIHPGMVVYEGDPGVRVTSVLALERGDPANVSLLALGSHTGTHVDAPSHFIAGGGTVDGLPLDVLLGRARVLACPPGPIVAETVAGAGARRGSRLLFKTGNSALWERARFVRDYQALTLEAARLLVEAGVALVGIDYLSIEGFGAPGHPVHRCLLGAGTVILEGLDLSAVAPGEYELCCLPLRVREGDGAPARALLRPLHAP
ncbi:MAG: cyclase family protein [Candidatus Rokubacteria bacterium]|nr:cyclase family protein [Candidatus Rokubacteria bacterium]